MSSSERSLKRQRLDQGLYDVAARTRVVPFQKGEDCAVFAAFMQNLEDQFNQASQAGFWANRDIFSVTNLLHFFIYDLWRPGDEDRPPVEDRGELDPIFKLLDWDCAQPLRFWGGDSSAIRHLFPWPQL